MDDNTWRAVQAARVPVVGETTGSGLPLRLPQANLTPGAAVDNGSTDTGLSREPEAVRDRWAAYAQGVEEGRSGVPTLTPNTLPSAPLGPEAKGDNKMSSKGTLKNHGNSDAKPLPEPTPLHPLPEGWDQPWGKGWKPFTP
jgi:hypothetical protein